MPTSSAVTRGIRIEVESTYDPGRSRPHDSYWFFVYKIRITNGCGEAVQLLSRHWVITDSDGKVEEVRGPGVVGRQPVLDPGDAFEYSSACPLGTSFGTMHGTYQMIATRSGEPFDVEIAPFALGQPHSIN
jgi:ApaG protein